MSTKDSKTTTKANEKLPDEDALSAFRAPVPGAFAPRRKTAAATTPKAVEPAAPEPAAPAAQKKTEPEATTPPPAAAVQPEKKPAPEPAAPPAAAPVPAPASSTETAPTEPAAAPQAQVAVRMGTLPTVVQKPVPLPHRQAGDVGQVEVPSLGAMGTRAVQCTVMVAVSTRDRLAQYQQTKRIETGKEPTNATVVRRAFLHTRKNDLFGKLLNDLHHRHNPVDGEEDFDDDGLLGDVAGRRTERGRMKDNVQQSFRPSMQELAAYDAFAEAYQFPNRSEFLDAVLDEFLPPMPANRRNR